MPPPPNLAASCANVLNAEVNSESGPRRLQIIHSMSLLRLLKRNRVKVALCIALLADAIQIPVSMIAATGVMLPIAESFIVLVDLLAMALIMWCLGFHWILLPSFALEALPGLDAIPTWTLCVVYLARTNKHSPVSGKPEPGIIDIEATRVASEFRSSANVSVPPIIKTGRLS